MPATPRRRSPSVGPPTATKSAQRTPATQKRTPLASSQHGSAVGRSIAVTPHGKAAAREYAARRAALTPGKDRRRSGKQQRETPRETLRLLSRALAPKSQLTATTPKRSSLTSEDRGRMQRIEYEDDDPIPLAPRLSIPLNDDADDDSLMLPPKLHGVEDVNTTILSVEAPRRATNELSNNRLSRGSLGSNRISDYSLGGDTSLPYIAYAGSDSNVEIQDLGYDNDVATLSTGANAAYRVGADDPSIFNGDDDLTTRSQPDVLDPDFQFNILPQDPRDSPPDQVQQPIRGQSPDMEPTHGNAAYDEGLHRELRSDLELQSSPPPVDPTSGFATIEVRRPRPAIRISRISRHGLQYPPLPLAPVKRHAMVSARKGGNTQSKLGRDTLEAIMQASEWFFEQASEDLSVYAKHAGRRTIEEPDVLALMKRQRLLGSATTPFSLAQKHLPRELLQELRMADPALSRRRAKPSS